MLSIIRYFFNFMWVQIYYLIHLIYHFIVLIIYTFISWNRNWFIYKIIIWIYQHIGYTYIYSLSILKHLLNQHIYLVKHKCCFQFCPLLIIRNKIWLSVLDILNKKSLLHQWLGKWLQCYLWSISLNLCKDIYWETSQSE